MSVFQTHKSQFFHQKKKKIEETKTPSTFFVNSLTPTAGLESWGVDFSLHDDTMGFVGHERCNIYLGAAMSRNPNGHTFRL